MFKYSEAMPAAKGDTRQLIVDTALRLFEERGYAATTMRAIATEAGLAPSNAYYWFANKDELVQAFYLRIQQEHAQRREEPSSPHGGTHCTPRVNTGHTPP